MKKITFVFLLLVSFAFAQPGTIDASFNTGSGPDTAVLASVTQSDGKIIIGGAFSTYDGVSRSRMARINPDGSLDSSFNPGTGLPSGEEVYSIALQSDGKVIIAGYFSSYNGTARNHIARLNQDGSLDTTFNVGTGANDYIMSVALQSDGKVIVGGFFTSYNGTAKNRIMRLNSDGSIDNTFASGSGTNFYVYTLSVQPGDKIYVGGGFTAYNGVTCGHITRLNADGTRDATFVSGMLTNNAVLTHAVQADGKVVIGGYFASHTSVSRPGIARINANGTLDTTFVVGTGLNNYPLTMVAQPNGKIVVGGAFTSYNGASANRIVRLNADGSRDTAFLSGSGLADVGYMAVFQPDGKILLGSGSATYNGVATHPYFVRLNGYDPNALSVASVDGGPYCPGSTFSVGYTAVGYYTNTNVFTAQLSDASGSFASPTAIGSVVASASGTISVTIPGGTPTGSGYRIRVSASNLPTTGADNGADIAIQATTEYFADNDDDGYGDAQNSVFSCDALEGYVLDDSDCNDDDDTINPSMTEIPGNGIDDDCDGGIDNVVVSQVQPSQCGSALVNIHSIIGATYVTGATAYRFEVTDTATNAVQTLVRGVPNFNLTQLPQYDYNTTYSIRVELQLAGDWYGYYGPACTVSTPNVSGPGGAAQIVSTQCNATLSSMSTLIATKSLQGITRYRFRVTDLTDPDGPNQIQTIERGLHWFSLPMLARYNYGTTYSIEVAVKTANGAFSAYGQACNVTTPAVPQINGCGNTIALSTAITATSLQHVSTYRFEVTNLSTNQVNLIDRPLNWFTLNMVPGMTPSTNFSVRVSLMTAGEYSPFGASCEITSPALARENVKPSVGDFAAVAYPNPFSDAFSINLTGAGEQSVAVKVYDMTGRLVDSQQVSAGAFETAQWGSGYPSGVYQMVLTHGDEIRTLRLVKR